MELSLPWKAKTPADPPGLAGAAARVPLRIWLPLSVATIALLSFHIWAFCQPPPRSDTFDYLCGSLAEFPSIVIAILFLRRSSGPVRWRWMFFIAYLTVFFASTFTTSLYFAGLLPSDLHFFVGWLPKLAIPFILLSLTVFQAESSRLTGLMDGSLAIVLWALLSCLLYGQNGPFRTATGLLNFSLGVQVFLSLVAVLARFAAADAQEALFLRLASLYLCLRVLGAFCCNQVGYLYFHQTHASPWTLGLDFTQIAFAVLAGLTLLRPAEVRLPAHRSLFVRSIMPFFLALAVSAVGLTLIALGLHRFIGAAGILLALTFYAVRTVLVQRHYLSLHSNLLSTNRDLEALAGLDALTGVANRRAFTALLDRRTREAEQGSAGFCLCMIDVDGFKQANDLFGHGFGDQCLKSIADALASRLPASATLARYGGDEFAVLLPAISPTRALQVANDLRSAVLDLAIACADTTISISIGIAQALPGQPTQPSTLLESADRALYAAKDNGRNRCELSPHIAPA